MKISHWDCRTCIPPPILQLSSKRLHLHGVFYASSPICSFCSLLKHVTEAMVYTCASLSLAALLGTDCLLLEASQVAQIDSVRGWKNCIVKAVSAKGQRSGAVRGNKISRKSQISNPLPGLDSPRPLSTPTAGMHSKDILIQLVPVILNSRV